MAFSVLLHAETRPSDFRLKLTDGTVFAFESAKVHGDFVYLSKPRCNEFPYSLENGIDVRIDQIVWVVEVAARAQS